MNRPSFKQLQIDKGESRVLIIVGVATVIVVFCLVSTKALLAQAAYHRRELSAKNAAAKQLEANAASASTLATQFEVFDKTNPNVIGGKYTTDANALPPDGDSARIILDALPTRYDFPALISSVSKILSNSAIANPGIGGSDQSASIEASPSPKPQPVPIQLSISGVSSYGGLHNLIKDFERSIRPYDVTSLQLRGSAGSLTIAADLTTYFQPAKTLSSDTKEVK